MGRLMQSSIRVRLLASFLAVALGAAVGLSLYFLDQAEKYALRKLEERLEAEARLTATLIVASTGLEHASRGTGAQSGSSALAVAPTRRGPVLSSAAAATLDRALQKVGPMIASRVQVLDDTGVVIADSAGAAGRGVELGARPEVRAASGGAYGAATQVAPDGRVALRVAVPIEAGAAGSGAVRVSSTTFSIATVIRGYRIRLMALFLVYLALILGITEVLTRWLARPLAGLEEGAAAFAGGDHSVRVEPRGARETRSLARGFNAMAEEISGMVAELKAEEERKSRFVSDVSHELRTPLTAIRGAAETLLQEDVPPDARERFLTTIVGESDRLSRLAGDLAALERIEGGTGELVIGPVDLAMVVTRAVAALEPVLARRRVRVETRGCAPAVLGDADRLQQVVANLLDNAGRVTHDGGVVLAELEAGDRTAVLRVADEGPGIAEEDLPHVFERFYRAGVSRDRASGGSGLGLSIARAIVQSHGGTVEAARRPGGGAVFTVTLPAEG
jgi:two-component system, OmpR family, sensor kinase